MTFFRSIGKRRQPAPPPRLPAPRLNPPWGLADFRVGGLDDEDFAASQPVQVTCTQCGTASGWLTYRDDGGADQTAELSDLVAWAQGHQCPRDGRPA